MNCSVNTTTVLAIELIVTKAQSSVNPGSNMKNLKNDPLPLGRYRYVNVVVDLAFQKKSGRLWPCIPLASHHSRISPVSRCPAR